MELEERRSLCVLHIYFHRAIEVWGSMDALQRERKKRRDEELERNIQVSNVKRILRELARGGDTSKADRDAYHVE